MVTLAWLLAGVAALPLAIVAAECLAGLGATAAAEPSDAPPFAVLIPAHDEAAGIAETIAAVKRQLRPCDRLLVVADNCTDATAEVAVRAGAAVCRRDDRSRIGKAYALAFGRDALRPAPPAAVVVLDADCLPAPGALALLAAAAHRHGAAVQGRYLLTPPAGADPLVRLSSFAFRLKNDVRQRGLQRLGGVALLQGAGMAFPWRMFDRAPLATPSLVEDLQLGLDLALADHPVRFEGGATIRSRAGSLAATGTQRTRWEHGSLATAAAYLPRLLTGAARGRRDLLALAADLLVPPLTLLVTASGSVAAALLANILLGGAAGPLLLLLAAAAAFATGIGLAWRVALPLAALLDVPRYLLWKQPVYRRLVTGRERRWIRTSRAP